MCGLFEKRVDFFLYTVVSKKMTFFWYDLFGIVLTFVISKKQKGVVSACFCTTHIWGEEKKTSQNVYTVMDSPITWNDDYGKTYGAQSF